MGGRAAPLPSASFARHLSIWMLLESRCASRARRKGGECPPPRGGTRRLVSENRVLLFHAFLYSHFDHIHIHTHGCMWGVCPTAPFLVRKGGERNHSRSGSEGGTHTQRKGERKQRQGRSTKVTTAPRTRHSASRFRAFWRSHYFLLLFHFSLRVTSDRLVTAS